MKENDLNSIDKLAKEALENFEADLSPLDWLEMQHQLDAEQSVDDFAKDKLEHFEVAYDQTYWVDFEKHRQASKKPIFYIPWYKSAEIGLVSMMLLSFINFIEFPKNESPSYDKTTTQLATNIKSEATSSNVNDLYLNKKSIQVSDDANNAVSNDNQAAKSDEQSLKYIPTAGQNVNQSSVSFNKQAIVATTAEEHSNATSSNTINNQQLVAEPEQNEAELLNSNATDKQIARVEDNNNTWSQEEVLATAHRKINLKNKALRLLLPVHLKQISVHTEPLLEALQPVQIKKSNYKKLYIGGLTTLAANFENELGGSSIGYGAGLSFDADFSSHFGIKTGMMFSSKNYNLQQSYTLTPSLPDNPVFKVDSDINTHLVVVEIPLDLQFTFFRSDKWKIYATAGLKANLIASRTYSGTEQTTFNGLTLNKDVSSNPQEGFFAEGGNFEQHVFLSVGGGIGLERQLGDRLSIYILPVYRHAITAVNDIHIHSFNFNIGIRTAL